MGAFKFSSWTIHMASIIIFSTLWGIALKEWSGSSSHTRRLVLFSLILLVASTMVVGYGNYIGVSAN
jgi:L-rhamnose-H+ transport protein